MNRLKFVDGVATYAKDWEKQFTDVEDNIEIVSRYLFNDASAQGGVITGYKLQTNQTNPLTFDIVHDSNIYENLGVALDRHGVILISSSTGIRGVELSDLTVDNWNIVAIKSQIEEVGLDYKTGEATTAKRVSNSTYQAHFIYQLKGISANVYSLTEWYMLDEETRKDHVVIGRVRKITGDTLEFNYSWVVYLGAKLGDQSILNRHVNLTAGIQPIKLSSLDQENDNANNFFGPGRDEPSTLEEFLHKVITQIKKILGVGSWDVESPPSLEQVNPAGNRFRRSGTIINEEEDLAVSIIENDYFTGVKLRVGLGATLTEGRINIVSSESILSIESPEVLFVGNKTKNQFGQPVIGDPPDWGEIIIPGVPVVPPVEGDAVFLAHQALVANSTEILRQDNVFFPVFENLPVYTSTGYNPESPNILHTSTGVMHRGPGSFGSTTQKFYIKYETYLSRWDLIYFDSFEHTCKVLKGESGRNPIKPVLTGSGKQALKYIFIDALAFEKHDNKILPENIIDYQIFTTPLPFEEVAITSSTGVTNTGEIGKLTFFSGYAIKPLIDETYPLGLRPGPGGTTVVNPINAPIPEQDILTTVDTFGNSLVHGLLTPNVSNWVTNGKRKTTIDYPNTFASINVLLGNENDVYLLVDSGPQFDDIAVIVESSTGTIFESVLMKNAELDTIYYKLTGNSSTGRFYAGYYTISFRKATDDLSPITLLKTIWGAITFEAETGIFESLKVKREVIEGKIHNFIDMDLSSSTGVVNYLDLGDRDPEHQVDVRVKGDLRVENGHIFPSSIEIDGNYIAGDLSFIFANATSGPIIITLPVGVNNLTYTIKKIDSTANIITINPSGSDTVEDKSSLIIYSQYIAFTLMYNEATGNWAVINSGDIGKNVLAVTSNTILTSAFNTILADTSGGNIQLTLPSAVNFVNREITIKKVHANNYVTLIGDSGELIDGKSTIRFTNNNTTYVLLAYNGKWEIISIHDEGARILSISATTDLSNITNYPDATTYDTIICNNSADITLTLSPAVNFKNKIMTIKKISATGTPPDAIVTIEDDASEKIDGEDELKIYTQYTSYSLLSDGSTWHIIG